jgi:hypothetical protein
MVTLPLPWYYRCINILLLQFRKADRSSAHKDVETYQLLVCGATGTDPKVPIQSYNSDDKPTNVHGYKSYASRQAKTITSP